MQFINSEQLLDGGRAYQNYGLHSASLQSSPFQLSSAERVKEILSSYQNCHRNSKNVLFGSRFSHDSSRSGKGSHSRPRVEKKGRKKDGSNHLRIEGHGQKKGNLRYHLFKRESSRAAMHSKKINNKSATCLEKLEDRAVDERGIQFKT